MSPAPVPEDGRITDPGEYVLQRDRRVEGIVPASEAMIHIAADDVTLDGQGNAVVGKGVSDTVGIETAAEQSVETVTVENVRLAQWEVGLALTTVGQATVNGVEATANSYGLRLDRATAGSVSECSIRGNLVGVSVGPNSSFDDGATVGPNKLADLQRESACE